MGNRNPYEVLCIFRTTWNSRLPCFPPPLYPFPLLFSFFFSPLFFFSRCFLSIEEAAAEFGFLSCSAPARLGAQFPPLVHRSHLSPRLPLLLQLPGRGCCPFGKFCCMGPSPLFVARPANFCLYFSCFFFPRFWFTCQQLHSFAA